MGRLRELNDAIVRVTEEKEARALVATWQPDQEEAFEGGVGVEKGVRNCSLAAMFCVAFYKRNPRLPWGKQAAYVNYAFDLKKFVNGGSACLLLVAEQHNMAVIAEGNEYGLYQAWEGQYHVFPRLNEDDESHNIFGMGEDTIRLINNEVSFAYRKAKSADGEKGKKNTLAEGIGDYDITTW